VGFLGLACRGAGAPAPDLDEARFLPGFDPEGAARQVGLEFLTGYIVEKSLAVDNIFVISMIFTFFAVPAIYQHRVLFWGILGALVLRGLMIAAEAPTVFARLMAAAVTMSVFTYAFVNMGMVSGILPVVGVPLPFISYGGTALVTLCLGIGILMSIQRSRFAEKT